MIKLKKIKPLFTTVITTMDKYPELSYIPGTKILDATKVKNSIKEYQKVLEVGNMVRDIKVGDIVCINPKAYAHRKHEEGSLKNGVIGDNVVTHYVFNTLTINDEECLELNDRDIKFIVKEYEEVPDEIMIEGPRIEV